VLKIRAGTCPAVLSRDGVTLLQAFDPVRHLDRHGELD
jgi:hypothetical protein